MNEGIESAAQMALLGLDPFRFLDTHDYFERALLIQLHNRVMVLKKIQDENLAVAIANNVGRLFKK